MGIEHDLHDLLHDHDLVIVPRWGGFLTHYRGARLDDVRQVVHPPAKEIGFNPHLTRNDGTLADRVARRHGLRFEAASALVEREVEAWRHRLAAEGRLELPRIGVFFRDAEQNLQFDPDRRSNFLKEAFGLAPVAAIPVPKERPAPVVLAMQPPAGRSPVATRRTLRWAAAVAAVVALAAATWWLVRMGGPHGGAWNLAGLPGFGGERTYAGPAQVGSSPVRSPGVFVLPDEPLGIRSVPLQVNDSVFITVDLGRPAAPVLPADSTHVAVATPPADVAAKLRYHVVGGCFADPANAERFLGTLLAQGHPAQRLPRRGALHPVAFGSYATRAEALQALENVRSGGAPTAWLLVR